MSRRIILTAAWLRQHDACPEQVAAFRRLFGEAAEVCQETLDMAVTAGLSVAWLGWRVLTAPARAEHARVTAPAWAEHARAAEAAWAEYARVAAPAWAEYARVIAPAWAEYDRVAAPARAEYDRVTAPARAEYDRVAKAAMAALLADPANWNPEVLAELRGDA